MSERTIVTLSPDVLDTAGVLSALLWVDHFARYEDFVRGEEQIKATFSKRHQIEIFATRYDPGHQFGPVITVEGTHDGKKRSLEIIVPWHKVLAVVRDKTGEFKPGFALDHP